MGRRELADWLWEEGSGEKKGAGRLAVGRREWGEGKWQTGLGKKGPGRPAMGKEDIEDGYIGTLM